MISDNQETMSRQDAKYAGGLPFEPPTSERDAGCVGTWAFRLDYQGDNPS
jgi:hypothetical protein